jgi:hypothetical protein
LTGQLTGISEDVSDLDAKSAFDTRNRVKAEVFLQDLGDVLLDIAKCLLELLLLAQK